MRGGLQMRSGVVAGLAVGFLLLIAAVWASGASAATSLAVTGLLVLVAVAAVALGVSSGRPRDETDEQRDRMRRTTP